MFFFLSLILPKTRALAGQRGRNEKKQICFADFPSRCPEVIIEAGVFSVVGQFTQRITGDKTVKGQSDEERAGVMAFAGCQSFSLLPIVLLDEPVSAAISRTVKPRAFSSFGSFGSLPGYAL